MEDALESRESRIIFTHMTDPEQISNEMWSGPPAGRLRDLPQPLRDHFREWLRGSTIPHLNGVPNDEQDAFYLHDYRNWKAGYKHPSLW